MKLTPTKEIYNRMNFIIDQLEMSFIDLIEPIIDNVNRILIDPNSYRSDTDIEEIKKSHKILQTIWKSYYNGSKPCVYSHDSLKEVIYTLST